LALAVIAGGCVPKLAPPDPDAHPDIWHGVFADGEVYVANGGKLSAIDEREQVRRDLPISGTVLDVWLIDGQPAVLSCRPGNCSYWTLLRRTAGQWLESARIPTNGDLYLAGGHDGSRLTLITSRRIIEVAGDRSSSNRLSEPLHPYFQVAAVYLTTESVLVSLYGGEFGGGLRRIDRKTGRVQKIYCGGIGEECGSVNDIAVEPWNPSCVALAMGIVHFLPSGAIVELCNDRARLLVSQPVRDPQSESRDGEVVETVAFFDLIRDGDSLVASGSDGIYRLGPFGAVLTGEIPELRDQGGFNVSFERPEGVLIGTARPLAAGGGAFLLIQR
jgi:hypothetical protein